MIIKKMRRKKKTQQYAGREKREIAARCARSEKPACNLYENTSLLSSILLQSKLNKKSPSLLLMVTMSSASKAFSLVVALFEINQSRQSSLRWQLSGGNQITRKHCYRVINLGGS